MGDTWSKKNKHLITIMNQKDEVYPTTYNTVDTYNFLLVFTSLKTILVSR